MNQNPFETAASFVHETNTHIFLTGKAGTGKTTFLKSVLEKTRKNAAVVAPTGVAAINAGGVTIHSFFQLPTLSFIPKSDPVSPDNFVNPKTLAEQQKIRKSNRKVLANLELLIIDEVSMVRADILDAIDATLKRIRRSTAVFGGVQVLAIGDLYQLPPVVKEYEWLTLRNYYESPFFFHAESWQAAHAVVIELSEVFRQEDQVFVDLLNRVRSGLLSERDVAVLNERLKPKMDDDAVLLTTHNAQADVVNQSKLKALKGPDILLRSEVQGQFYESAYPVDEIISVRKGARVMLIRNHQDGLYYNGKIGTIINKEKDILWINTDEDEKPLAIAPVEWKNVRYSLSKKDGKVVQEELGTFKQYPLRLAWAVTVHKSQGLTFDKVNLDLQRSFAAGQLYVALSRCRTLEGITLVSPIESAHAMTDPMIQKYMAHQESGQQALAKRLMRERQQYAFIRLLKSFSFSHLMDALDEWKDVLEDSSIQHKKGGQVLIRTFFKALSQYQSTADTFCDQLKSRYVPDSTESDQFITTRCQKAIPYFSTQLYEGILVPIELHIKAYKPLKNTRKYIRIVREAADVVWQHIAHLHQVQYKGKTLAKAPFPHQREQMFDPDKTGQSKTVKVGETFDITLQMMKDGHSLEEIAKKRQYALSTIEGHVSRLIRDSKVRIQDVMDFDRIQKIKPYVQDNPDDNASDLKTRIPFPTTYAELRWMISAFR